MRRLQLIIASMIAVLGVQAQSWWIPLDRHRYNDETVASHGGYIWRFFRFYSEFPVILWKIPNRCLAVFGIYCNFAENSECKWYNTFNERLIFAS